MTHQAGAPDPSSIDLGAGRRELIAICAILMATVALSIDIMLPALGRMADDLSISASNQRQWIITALFVGLTFGQIFFGPLSDSIGRKPSIQLGVGVFIAGSMLCAMAVTFEQMILGRIVQGLGAAGPRVVTVALLRDRFAGAEMARIMSVIMGIFVMVPVLAPMFGQVLLFVLHWRGLFGVLQVICLAGGVWLALRQSETLAERRPMQPVALLNAFAEVLGDRRAVAFTLAGACCYGALMGYINSSQQIFQSLYKVGDSYALLFGISAASISAATLFNARFVRSWPMERICVHAVAAMLAWCLPALLVLQLLDGVPPLWVWMLYNGPVLFLLGLTFGNFNAIALRDLGHIAGLASAIVASINTSVSLIVSALIGLNFDMTVLPVVFGYSLFGSLALGLMLQANSVERERK